MYSRLVFSLLCSQEWPWMSDPPAATPKCWISGITSIYLGVLEIKLRASPCQLHIPSSVRPKFYFPLFEEYSLIQNHLRVSVQMRLLGLPQVSFHKSEAAMPRYGNSCMNSLTPRSFQSRVIMGLCNINIWWDAYPGTCLEPKHILDQIYIFYF